MKTSRLEAFSDGVIAILITVMVLELKIPHGRSWSALRPLLPTGFTYVLSFANLGFYWNNHHHLFQRVEKVSAGIMWANLNLLFWLSLVPIATGWVGENGFATVPTVGYGLVLLAAGTAYYVLVRAILASEPDDSALRAAVGRDRKGQVSVIIYAAAVVLAFADRWIAMAGYVAVVLLWIIPDRRLESLDQA